MKELPKQEVKHVDPNKSTEHKKSKTKFRVSYSTDMGTIPSKKHHTIPFALQICDMPDKSTEKKIVYLFLLQQLYLQKF